jgi:BlaI family penicillinase repressor
MARPKAKQLTERELEIMHIFWQQADSQNCGSTSLDLTTAEVRDLLALEDRDLAYTTVATLLRILVDKNYICQTNGQRPFTYQAVRTFQEVSGNLVSEMVDRVFHGSRESLLMRLVESKKLTKNERHLLQQILAEKKR